MEFDGALINALRDNGRLSVSELARRLQLPRRRVQERMHALLDSGEMRIIANVHPALLGIRTFCDVLIWVDGSVAPVIEGLRAFRETTFITSVAGNCDVVVEVSAEDDDHLSDLLMRIRALPGVRETVNSQLLQIHKSRFDTGGGTGGDTDASAFHTPDDHDTRIISLLRTDGRMPYRELSREVGLSIGAIRARVKRLTDSGRLRITCELQEPGVTPRMQLGASLRLCGEGHGLVEALCAIPAVEFVARSVGHFDIVMTLSGATPHALHTVLDEIRMLDDVGSVTSWMHLEVFRESYE
ncbi:Lrp/AsnC family transcriptional regulator [Leucobacter sp. CSA1]|uniref:Lrp/AsnC family transcriptional regulator n=1 Tax=Leucobacter chromiisoli TaxID=2796471 RepID=A0A934Q5I2_9MICO|nr:Lrp/AsnC family transcriptional regulator [Leucobacter chromiisoli]MBK0418709.1 Lrp/AsnC family transcriptional regulator [Leucobacter chromiisoli]